jgi:hypothetical protein
MSSEWNEFVGTVCWWLGAVVLIGAMLCAAISTHIWAWKKMWDRRKDWWYFLGYGLMRHHDPAKDGDAMAQRLRQFADRIEEEFHASRDAGWKDEEAS